MLGHNPPFFKARYNIKRVTVDMKKFGIGIHIPKQKNSINILGGLIKPSAINIIFSFKKKLSVKV